MMKSTLAKLLALCLAMMMIVTLFAACTNTEDDPKDTTAKTDDATEAPTEEVTEPADDVLGVMPENNNGEEVKILLGKGHAKNETCLEPSEERVPQALYERNCEIEEYLGIVLTYNTEHYDDWNNRTSYNDVIRKDVSNEHEADIIVAAISSSFMTCVEENLIADLSTIETFNFNAPWWFDRLTDVFAINGKQFGAMGDISMGTYSGLQAIWFNATMSEAYQLESPYKAVRDNTWTLEKLFTNGKVVEETVDGEYDPYKHKMGLLSLHTSNRTWIAALDLHLVDRNEATGVVTVPSSPNEKCIDVFNKMLDVFENENEFVVTRTSGDNAKTFGQGTVLYLLQGLSAVNNFRDMEDDYGLVPMPKYDSNQEKYYAVGGNLVWMLPSTATEENNILSAKVMEVMGYLNRQDVVPEYYDITLGLTLARDENVQEMLAHIRDGAVIRWEYVFDRVFSPSIWNMLQMDEQFRHPISEKVNVYHGQNVVTWWEYNQQTWANAVADLYERLS
ncbi:MAG: extracellular solute-binding protein [Clostridia bacterium]|nr:extracellular solute-binding protein [Clostridia bacterium]